MASRTALVTGGTGGLGPAVIAALLADGWRVVAPHRAGSAVERLPDGAETVVADLADPDAVASAVAAAAGEPAAPLRAVCNLAGGWAGGAPVAEAPVEVLDRLLALNLRPTYLVTRAALAPLAAAGGGSVVCVAARAAVEPFAGAAAYVAAKAAVLGFARVVALEGAGDGIRCNTLLPRVIDTPANRAAGMSAGVAPERVAAVVAWLCGEASAALTGAAIPV